MTQPVLSARQLQVMLLITKGLRSRDIAGRLGIKLSTAMTHRKAVYARTGARSPIQLYHWARGKGLIRDST